jgi:hypothetical protein
VLEAALNRDAMARQQRHLRRMAGELFEHCEAVGSSELADCVHLRIEVERRQSRSRIADFGDAQPDLCPYDRKRVGRHYLPPVKGSLSHFG